MLTIVYLMHAIDGVKYQCEIEELFTKLIEIDSMRKGYYQDLSELSLLKLMVQTLTS